MPETDYILTIQYPPGDAAAEDRVEAVLFLSSCLGSTIGERDGLTLVECYFNNAEDRDGVARTLADLKTETAERPRVDWLRLYRQSLVPIEIGRKFVVVPDSAVATDPSRTRLVIPQERAFGTGSHESTSLCLELLEELDLGGKRCLDAGTGSGILAIAMVKLGARRVFAFDNDFETFGILSRNIARNALRHGAVLQFFGEPSAVRPVEFGVITMNIIPEVIEPLLPAAVRLLGGQSSLIVSGITGYRREGFVAKATAAGLRVVRERVSGEWWAAELRK